MIKLNIPLMGVIEIRGFWDSVYEHTARRTGKFPDEFDKQVKRYGYKTIGKAKK